MGKLNFICRKTNTTKNHHTHKKNDQIVFTIRPFLLTNLNNLTTWN
jgi:hypothetical protein